MKTIKQVADTLGVSRQAIYRRLSALPSATLSTNDKGVQLINADGEAILQAELSEKVSDEQSANSLNSTSDNIVDTIIAMLQKELESKDKQLEAKDKQLDVKDKQIEELTATIRIQAESINAAQHNALAETIIDTQSIAAHSDEADGDNKKRGFWRFWKK